VQQQSQGGSSNSFLGGLSIVSSSSNNNNNAALSALTSAEAARREAFDAAQDVNAALASLAETVRSLVEESNTEFEREKDDPVSFPHPSFVVTRSRCLPYAAIYLLLYLSNCSWSACVAFWTTN
jgi:hypothetical protein